MSNKSNIKALSRDFKKFLDLTDEQVGIVSRKIAFDIQTKLTQQTPRDTGRASANWFPSIGTPSEEVSERTTPVNFDSVISSDLPPLTKLWVTNNLPYIIPLNDGHSDQAPLNFVDIVVFEVVESL